MEEVYHLLLPRLTENRAYSPDFRVDGDHQPLEQSVTEAYQTAAAKQETDYQPAETGVSGYEKPAEVTDKLLLFIGCYQLPMYLTPMLLGRFYRR